MESYQRRLNSLKDTLLEYAVLNFNVVFPSEKYIDDSVPKFPKYLFEEILEKSKDMCWPMRSSDMMTCIAARNRLKWSETSIFRFVDEFHAEKLNFFVRSRLTSLKVTVTLSKPTDVNYFYQIWKATDTLQDLDLSIYIEEHFRSSCLNECNSYIEGIKNEIGECTILNLKRLRLNLRSFEMFPYTLVSNSLTVLDVYICTLTKVFLQQLVDCKQLVHLSIESSLLQDISFEELIDAVACLKRLHFLSLRIMSGWLDDTLLNKITSGLANLDMLELWGIKLEEPNRLISRRKKLNVITLMTKICNNAMSALKGLAHRIGHFNDLEGLMTITSTTPTESLYKSAIRKLFAKILKKGVDQTALVEAEKRGILHFRSPLRLCETFRSRPCLNSSYDISRRMTCLALKCNAECNLFYKGWIRDIIDRNVNTHMGKRLLRYYNMLLSDTYQ